MARIRKRRNHSVIRTSLKEKLSFNLQEASYLLGISRSTLYRWLDEGRFPHAWKTSPHGGGYRIPREDIEQVKAAYLTTPVKHS